jgi:hypothetical protein
MTDYSLLLLRSRFHRYSLCLCNIAHSNFQEISSNLRDSKEQNNFALNSCINLITIICHINQSLLIILMIASA